jgi:hypothetical protein
VRILKDVVVPLNRPLFIPKDGTISRENLIIEAGGNYKLIEKEDCFMVINDDCCKSMKIIVKVKEESD